jgi:hypothetical protein
MAKVVTLKKLLFFLSSKNLDFFVKGKSRFLPALIFSMMTRSAITLDFTIRKKNLIQEFVAKAVIEKISSNFLPFSKI